MALPDAPLVAHGPQRQLQLPGMTMRQHLPPAYPQEQSNLIFVFPGTIPGVAICAGPPQSLLGATLPMPAIPLSAPGLLPNVAPPLAFGTVLPYSGPVAGAPMLCAAGASMPIGASSSMPVGAMAPVHVGFGASMPMGPGGSLPLGAGASVPLGAGMPMGVGVSMPPAAGSTMLMGACASLPTGTGATMPIGGGAALPMGTAAGLPGIGMLPPQMATLPLGGVALPGGQLYAGSAMCGPLFLPYTAPAVGNIALSSPMSGTATGTTPAFFAIANTPAPMTPQMRRSPSGPRGLGSRVTPGSRRLISRRMPPRRPGARTVARVGIRGGIRSAHKAFDDPCTDFPLLDGVEVQEFSDHIAMAPTAPMSDLNSMMPFTELRLGDVDTRVQEFAPPPPHMGTSALPKEASQQFPPLPQLAQLPLAALRHPIGSTGMPCQPHSAGMHLNAPHTALALSAIVGAACMAAQPGAAAARAAPDAGLAGVWPGAAAAAAAPAPAGEGSHVQGLVHPAAVSAAAELVGMGPPPSLLLPSARHGAVVPPVLVWRCRHPHGLFSMFSLALGHALQCEQRGVALIVDWSGEELLYRGPPGEPNLWTAFFHQPAELTVQPSLLARALRQRQFCETDKHDAVFGAYRGVVQGYGGIPAAQATQGRALIRRSVVLRERFAQRLRSAAELLLGGGHRWLAVHIRRGDKAIEAQANFQLDDDDLTLRIVAQCAAWRCSAVFLCTDDAGLKQRLRARLESGVASGGVGLCVSIYPSALSSVAGQAAHFDKSLDSYTKAEDVMMEALLMARGCHGLLSTYSNVSAAVVYLSPEGYPYTSFWDQVESLPEPVVPAPPATCSMEAGVHSELVVPLALGCAR